MQKENRGERKDVKWWFILVIIWALGCIRMHILHADKIDQLKEKDPNNSPILYDIVGIGILLCWPLLMPKIITKSIRIIKEKKRK